MGVISYRNRSKGQVDKNGRARKPSWEYRFYGAMVAGRRVCFSKAGFPTKQAAIEAGTRAQNEYMSTGSVFRPSDISYSDCLDRWMENYVQIRCAPSTVRNYENMLRNHIRPALGMYRVVAIRHETVQRFILSMYRQKYARNTMVNLLALISGSMRYVKRQGWIEKNPAEDIDLPATRECAGLHHKVRAPVSQEAIQAMLTRFYEGNPAHLPIMLAYHCGLRRGEVFGLAWDDIDLERGIMMVNHQMQWREAAGAWQLVPPKYKSVRRIQLDQVILDLLKQTRAHQLKRKAHYGELYTNNYLNADGYLNEDGNGTPVELVMLRDNGTCITPHIVSYISEIVRLDLGYEHFDFHSLRHTHAKELSENGVNIKEIQRRLGHKTMEVTSRTYLHATDRMEAESVRIMNKMYGAEG